ncbi:non-secretory ribonuclease-like [Nycticebus coucang]|uniref:non-secretory ribonuclease-like n=1 Tax=Nycticebus coucang TaxID=9470 RepID=UPI00234D9E32|nr:non-secretory ribonuclease-like [Nycticebus coucang]
MVPKLLDSRLCLLLLLGLMAMVGPFHAKPANFTWAQWFQFQHINRNPHCNYAMQAINRYYPRCKNKNTFLHTTFGAVAGVCGTPNEPCVTNSSRTNCHNSSVPVTFTYCDLTSRPTPVRNCRYAQTRTRGLYVVACDNRSAQDSPLYPVVPVHLDAA